MNKHIAKLSPQLKKNKKSKTLIQPRRRKKLKQNEKKMKIISKSKKWLWRVRRSNIWANDALVLQLTADYDSPEKFQISNERGNRWMNWELRYINEWDIQETVFDFFVVQHSVHKGLLMYCEMILKFLEGN